MQIHAPQHISASDAPPPGASHPGVAQFGSARRSGRRSRRFDSCRPDSSRMRTCMVRVSNHALRLERRAKDSFEFLLLAAVPLNVRQGDSRCQKKGFDRW